MLLEAGAILSAACLGALAGGAICLARTRIHITADDLSVAKPGDLLIIKTLQPLTENQYGFAEQEIRRLAESHPEIEVLVLDATTDKIIIPAGASR